MADVACETSCSSLWSLLLGHARLSSCYRLICRVLYYPIRGAEVRALLPDAQRARVLTLAVVDLAAALSMLPLPPECCARLVRAQVHPTPKSTTGSCALWPTTRRPRTGTRVSCHPRGPWLSRRLLPRTLWGWERPTWRQRFDKRASARHGQLEATSAVRERSSGAVCLASLPLVAGHPVRGGRARLGF